MGMQLIEHIEVGSGGVASIEFTGIAGTGQDLLLKVSSRNSADSDAHRWTFNGLTTGIYSEVRLSGNGSSSSSSSRTNDTKIYLRTVRSSRTANTFGSYSLYISNYASTTTSKSVSVDLVTENNATAAEQDLHAISFAENGAIISMQETESLAAGTTLSLYKITAD